MYFSGICSSSFQPIVIWISGVFLWSLKSLQFSSPLNFWPPMSRSNTPAKSDVPLRQKSLFQVMISIILPASSRETYTGSGMDPALQ